MRTRVAKVKRPLLCVADLIDNNQTVVFDGQGSFAVDKATGRRLAFERVGKGWEIELDLKSPDAANSTLAELKEQKQAEAAQQQQQPQVHIQIGSAPGFARQVRL